MLFQQLSTYLLEILIRIIVGTCFLWTDIYTKKYLRITVIRPIGVTPYQGRELLQTYMCQYIEVDTNDKPYDLPVSCHG